MENKKEQNKVQKTRKTKYIIITTVAIVVMLFIALLLIEDPAPEIQSRITEDEYKKMETEYQEQLKENRVYDAKYQVFLSELAKDVDEPYKELLKDTREHVKSVSPTESGLYEELEDIKKDSKSYESFLRSIKLVEDFRELTYKNTKKLLDETKMLTPEIFVD